MTKVLDDVRHARILADFERVCTTAGLQGKFMRESMTTYCDSPETDWVRHFHEHKAKGVPGLILEGVQRPDTKCQAICAALLRNYIDARIIPVTTILDMQESGSMPEPTVLLIPNLFISAMGKALPAWKVQGLYDLLLHRSVTGKPTVAYVENLQALRTAYGHPFADHLLDYKISK